MRWNSDSLHGGKLRAVKVALRRPLIRRAKQGWDLEQVLTLLGRPRVVTSNQKVPEGGLPVTLLRHSDLSLLSIGRRALNLGVRSFALPIWFLVIRWHVGWAPVLLLELGKRVVERSRVPNPGGRYVISLPGCGFAFEASVSSPISRWPSCPHARASVVPNAIAAAKTSPTLEAFMVREARRDVGVAFDGEAELQIVVDHRSAPCVAGLHEIEKGFNAACESTLQTPVR